MLFTDAVFSEWLLVPEKDVKKWDRVADTTAPGGMRDYLWVDVEARVGRGNASLSPASIFLTGAFIRAGNLDTAPSGGTTPSVASGLLCQATTPLCCGSNSRKP